jgi:CheY-like chemotaxis protein
MEPKSVLVVDDDPSILAVVRGILESEGYHVSTATNGMDGLEAMRVAPYALVILDMRMPIVDGWSFTSFLDAFDNPVPILVMTAGQDAQEWAKEVGATHYLEKPFDLPDLLNAVTAIIGPARTEAT